MRIKIRICIGTVFRSFLDPDPYLPIPNTDPDPHMHANNMEAKDVRFKILIRYQFRDLGR